MSIRETLLSIQNAPFSFLNLTLADAKLDRLDLRAGRGIQTALYIHGLAS